MIKQKENSELTVLNRDAQAMIEFLFMMPLLVTMMIFIYQSYVMIHKAQIAQKELKLAIVSSLMNQYEISLSPFANSSSPGTAKLIPKYFFNYQETTGDKMKFEFDSVTSSLILSFASSKQQAKMGKVLNSFAGKNQLGVCLDSNITKEIGPGVFSSLKNCQ